MRSQASERERHACSTMKNSLVTLVKGRSHRVSFEKAQLAGLVSVVALPVPSGVGDQGILGFLPVQDVMSVRATSRQLKQWAEVNLSRRTSISIHGEENLQGDQLMKTLALCPAFDSLELRDCIQVVLNDHTFQPSCHKTSGHSFTHQIKHLSIRDCPKMLPYQPLEECHLEEEEQNEPCWVYPMVDLLRGCTSLVRIESDALCDKALAVLGKAAGHSLRALSCRGSCWRLTGNGIIAMLRHCSQIEELDVAGCAVGDNHLRTLTGMECVRHSLWKLDISHCGEAKDEHGRRQSVVLTEEGVAEAIDRLRALQSLTCIGLNPSGPLFQAIQHYRGVDIERSILLGDSEQDNTEASESKEDDGDQEYSFVVSQRKLVKAPFTCLRLGDCPLLTKPDDFSAMIKACGASLQEFELSGCRGMSDIVGLCEIPKYCPNLRTLVLSGCEGVTDIFLISLAQRCPHIEKLVLRRCQRVTDVGVKHVTENLQSLRHVDLSGCTKLSSKTMVHFASCKSLSMLILSCCSKIEDEGILTALQATPWAFRRLVFLDISWCFRLSADCVMQFVKHTPYLREMCVEGLEHMTQVDFARFRSYAIRLRFSSFHDESGDDIGWDASINKGRLRRSTSVASDTSSEESRSSSSASRPKLSRKSSSRKLLVHHQPSGASPMNRRHTITCTSEASFGFFPSTPSPRHPDHVISFSPRRDALHFGEQNENINSANIVSMDAKKRQGEDKKKSNKFLSRRLSLEDLEALENDVAAPPPAVRERSKSLLVGDNAYSSSSRVLKSLSTNTPSAALSSSSMFGHRRFGDAQTDMDRLNAFASLSSH